MKRFWHCIPALAVMVGGCVPDPISPDYQHDVDNTDEPPVIIETHISNMSGLCMSQNGDFLWGISDSEGLFKFDLNGQKIEHVFDSGQDFEAVAVDPATGIVYLVEETKPDGKIQTNAKGLWKLDPTTNQPVLVAVIDQAGDVVNKGLEALTIVDGEAWLGNQSDPTDIYRYDLASGQVVGTVSITWARFLSDFCYDAQEDVFWCTDSKAMEISKFGRDGKRLQTWNMPGNFVKCEGIALDRQNGYMWLCSDETGYLMKVKFPF